MMDPLTADITEPTQWEGIGPQPSPIAVSRYFVLQPDIDIALESTGMNENRDSALRLAGAEFIDALRKSIFLPVTVYNTGCMLFAKLRLDYHERNYNLQDACTAAVFLACKLEDIFKKIKEVVAAANNLQNNGDRVYPDDAFIDPQVKRVLQCERMLIEACRMDFRTRHPHKLALAMATQCSFSPQVAMTAYQLTLDLHRTWAPLKQASAVMAIACVELAVKMSGGDYKTLYDASRGEGNFIDLQRLKSPRYLIIETMNELLDIYSFSVARMRTLVGKEHPENFITKLKLEIVRELKDIKDKPDDLSVAINGIRNYIADIQSKNNAGVPTAPASATISPTSPSTPATPSAPRGPLNPVRAADHTVRFVLNPVDMIEERMQQAKYLPTEVTRSEVPHWQLKYSDNRMADIKVDEKTGRPLMSANGHPLGADGKEIKVRNSFDARKKLDRQIKDGEFGKA